VRAISCIKKMWRKPFSVAPQCDLFPHYKTISRISCTELSKQQSNPLTRQQRNRKYKGCPSFAQVGTNI